jgi:tetratricopeptide (TPR) repeat protein
MKNAASLPPGSRLHGLSDNAIRSVTAAADALDRGRVAQAEQQVVGLLALYPNHPEILRLYAGVQNLRGDFSGAIATMERAIASRPDDAVYLNTLASSLIELTDYDKAIATLRRAVVLDPNLTTPWYNLGLALMRTMQVDESATALRRALALSPELAMSAHAIIGDMFRAENRLDEATSEFRAALAQQPYAGMAWWGLADIKTTRFSDDDVEKLRKALRHPRASEDDLVAMGFALAKALDERGNYSESLSTLAQANARVRTRRRWDPVGYATHIDNILKAFTPPPAGAAEPLGHEVIFIVSMPRSGSTLIEQVLASHSQVDGAGELSDLPLVLGEESRRVGKSFPEFIHALQPADWERLGKRYLERTVRWRRKKARFTDKLPSNWLYIGAIRAMLPGARILIGRRDPLETCFSCYRQRLANNEYTRTFADLASTWRDFDRAAKHWQQLHPTRVLENSYENLVADPEKNIRELLAFCDLPFEQTCVEFHKTEREVHTPSAAQVRQPLRRDTARAPKYGALLNPLRAELGIPAFADV